MDTIYLDNAATTPMHDEVLQAMLPYLKQNFGNPSTTYSIGRTAKAAIESARKTLAQLINAHPSEIIFTAGGTEANNLAIKSAVAHLGIERIITSVIEHSCVKNTVQYLHDFNGIELIKLPVDELGIINLEALETLLQNSSKKTLVTLMHANNEIGTLLDIKKVSELCQHYQAVFHSDTVQTFGHYQLDVQTVPIDFLSGAAHKFHGPKGVGFLYRKKINKIEPQIHGGGQERGMRSGTENVSGIVGLAKAAEIAYAHLEKEMQQIKALKQYTIEQLNEKISNISFNGPTDDRALYTVLNIALPNNDKTAMIIFALDMEGICVSGGSACNSGAIMGSPVIQALGKQNDTVPIRISFSKNTTKKEIDVFVEKLAAIL
ncbi:MAG: cysteine desulfurase [Chitinophagales bacterium]|nr:cysteine desulfurase [Chitinophagales bacterium]